MIQWRKMRGTALFLSCVVMLSVTGCGAEQETVSIPELIEPAGVDVDTAVVKKMDFSSIESYQGEIVPDIKGLYFLNSGNIGKMYVSIGDKVKKGQLLATLTSADGGVKEIKAQIKSQIKENADTNRISRCEIERLREELKKLRSQWKKQTDKTAKKGLKQQVLEKEEDIKIASLSLSQQKETQALELQFLRQDLEDAKKLSRESKLIAPASGEIISTAGGSGYMVQGGVTAVNMADMDHLKIRTSYIATSKVGKASSYAAVVNGKQYRVKVEEQELDQLDIEMENYPDYTWFDFVDTGDFEVGDSATIELYNDTAEDALVVPSNSVFRVKSEHYVYKMDGNAKKKTSVTIGTTTDAYTQILTGVKEGDVVYVQD